MSRKRKNNLSIDLSRNSDYRNKKDQLKDNNKNHKRNTSNG